MKLVLCLYWVSLKPLPKSRLITTVNHDKDKYSKEPVRTQTKNKRIAIGRERETKVLTTNNNARKVKLIPESRINPLTPKISLVILLTVCHTVLVMLACRIWY